MHYHCANPLGQINEISEQKGLKSTHGNKKNSKTVCRQFKNTSWLTVQPQMNEHVLCPQHLYSLSEASRTYTRQERSASWSTKSNS
jgi:hypothetical protein